MKRRKLLLKGLAVVALGLMWLGTRPHVALAAGSCDFCGNSCPGNLGSYCRTNCSGSVGASCSNNNGVGCWDSQGHWAQYEVVCTLPD